MLNYIISYLGFRYNHGHSEKLLRIRKSSKYVFSPRVLNAAGFVSVPLVYMTRYMYILFYIYIIYLYIYIYINIIYIVTMWCAMDVLMA